MAINPKPIDRELTQDEQFVLHTFFEAKRDAAKAAFCFDLSPWVFRYDNKFVLMLKCPEGPVEEMILVNSLHEATQLFGKDLFDQTKDHFDPVTKACYQILLNEPCYIVRTFRPRKVVFTDKEVKMTVEDQLEKFLLKTMGRKDWPISGNPIHWYIDINDEDWFNELAHLSENAKFSEEKGDFTEINFVPDNFIHIAGWRGNVMFTLPLYPKKEKPVYTLKEGIKKISEFIIAGKIKIPGFEYN